MHHTTSGFRTIYADPPFRVASPFARGTNHHYPLMTTEQIARMPVADLAADDSALLLWCSGPSLLAALEVMAAWGWTYKTHAVWDKYYMGLGNYFRSTHEILLFGVRGRVDFQFHGQRSMLHFPRTEHSRKPDEMYPLIERILPGPYLELFARRRPNTRADWSVWGDEIESDISISGYPVPSDRRPRKRDMGTAA